MMEKEGELLKQEYIYLKDPALLTKSLKVMLLILVFITILSLFFDFMHWQFPSEDEATKEDIEISDIVQLIFFLFYLIGLFIFNITYMIWVYRANLNCHGFGAQGMKFSPGWAVGYHFIPILNMYRPYQIIKEVWRVSKNPSDWKKEKVSNLVSIWYLLIWLNVALSHALAKMVGMTQQINFLYNAIVVVSDIFWIALFIVWYLLISQIFNMQESLTGRVNRMSYENR